MRNLKFQTGDFYHIYNCGVDKREIFIDKKDYIRFIRSMREFNCVETIGSLYEKKLFSKRKKETQFLIGNWVSWAREISWYYLLLLKFKSLSFYIKAIARKRNRKVYA